MVMTEVWKDVVNYEGYYQVSNLGNVRSVDRIVRNKLFVGKIMKQDINKQGYHRVSLFKCGTKRNFFVHVLVLNAFEKNIHNLPQINHKDENSHNNKLDNLEYCTASYNVNYGTAKWRALAKRIKILSKSIYCYENNKIYDNAHHASDELKINRRHICDVCNNKRKTCGGYHFKYVDE